MTLYDNRPTHFFSATKEVHGHPKEVFRSSPHIRKRTILTLVELGPYSESVPCPFLPEFLGRC